MADYAYAICQGQYGADYLSEFFQRRSNPFRKLPFFTVPDSMEEASEAAKRMADLALPPFTTAAGTAGVAQTYASESCPRNEEMLATIEATRIDF